MSFECPQCGTPSFSVPGVVSRGTQFQVSHTDGSFSGGGIQPFSPNGPLDSLMVMGGGVHSTTEQTARSQLASELSAPPVCPDSTDFMTDGAMFWGVFKALSIPVLIVAVIMGLTHAFSPLSPATLKQSVGFAILWGGLGLLAGLAHVLSIPGGRRKAAAIHAQHTWEAARYANWEQLRYCERDHLVFDPRNGEREVATESGLYRLLRRLTP